MQGKRDGGTRRSVFLGAVTLLVALVEGAPGPACAVDEVDRRYTLFFPVRGPDQGECVAYLRLARDASEIRRIRSAYLNWAELRLLAPDSEDGLAFMAGVEVRAGLEPDATLLARRDSFPLGVRSARLDVEYFGDLTDIFSGGPETWLVWRCVQVAPATRWPPHGYLVEATVSLTVELF